MTKTRTRNQGNIWGFPRVVDDPGVW
ncbi:hypothetical protein KR51_00017210, partial [Rubidibacter lacunae KORDI 51-2]